MGAVGGGCDGSPMWLSMCSMGWLRGDRAEENLEAGACLSSLLEPDVTLASMPRSWLIKEGSLWLALVICEALKDRGIGAAVLPCLRRAEAIGKAALAAPGRRPDPPEHYAPSESSRSGHSMPRVPWCSSTTS